MGRGFSPLWLSSTWDLNSAVTLSFLSCVVSLPRAEKPWLQSEQRQATGFPSIFSVTINCGIYPASHRWAVSGCAKKNTPVVTVICHTYGAATTFIAAHSTRAQIRIAKDPLLGRKHPSKGVTLPFYCVLFLQALFRPALAPVHVAVDRKIWPHRTQPPEKSKQSQTWPQAVPTRGTDIRQGWEDKASAIVGTPDQFWSIKS
jgi:hypothetical protein